MKINSENRLATNKECIYRRNFLINAGIITPGNIDKDRRREDLIKCGLIQPLFFKDGSIKYCDLPPNRNYLFYSSEGEYKSKPIISDNDYYRRRQVYFRMIQEVLHSRISLNLILGKKKNSDPDWYF